MSVTLLPNTPLYQGSAVTASGIPGLLPVAIGGHPYLIELSEYRRGVVDQLREASDQSREPGEQSFNTQGLWRRSQSDFSLGAGQTFFDNENSTRRRFRSSKGVNPWVEDVLTLHNDTAVRVVSVATNQRVLAAGVRLHHVSALGVSFSTDGVAFTAMTGLAGTAVNDLVTDGVNLWVADGTNVKTGSTGSAAFAAGWAFNAKYLAYVNGRLLAVDNTTLVELQAGGVVSASLKTLLGGQLWRGITGSPTFIYAWTLTGNRSEVYKIGVNEATGALTAPIIANGGWPEGETILSMGFYGGAMIIGTSRGIRIGTIEANGGLTWGPVIEVGPVTAFEGQGEFVWFSWTNHDGSSTGLGRLDLSAFTAELVPAYASDLMTTGSGEVTSVETFLSKRYFTATGIGLVAETSTPVATGDIFSGWIRYGNFERKIVSSIDVRTTPLAGTVGIHVHAEDGTHVDVATFSDINTLGPLLPFSVMGANGESIEVHISLNRVSGVGPSLRRWTMRAIATPPVVEEILVPIVMADTVVNDVGEGQKIHYNPLDEYTYLLGLVNSKAAVRYQEGSQSFNVYVTKVEIIGRKWSRKYKFFEGIYAVRLLTIQSTG